MRPTLILAATAFAILSPVRSWEVSFYSDAHCAANAEIGVASGDATATPQGVVRITRAPNSRCLHFDTAFPANCRFQLTRGNIRQSWSGPVVSGHRIENHPFDTFSYSCQGVAPAPAAVNP
ncbi:hypothetical protein BDP27DRAFT_1367094 [Rhodocollybia butyracea]|uniref:Uncharacterized protein n=1 Tax=Rhodocollybia butyracea TaxID=206335 RepID=A0A9P5PJN8_9AGAR|nr:hypothetical protein BDP27DRAFT_1367094 [Rhodocollybia butyracea]